MKYAWVNETEAQKASKFGGLNETEAQKASKQFGGAVKVNSVFFKSKVKRQCVSCGNVRDIGAPVYRKGKKYCGDCSCTKHLPYMSSMKMKLIMIK